MAYNEILGARISDYLISRNENFVAKRMFGGLCFMVNDKMCMGIVGDELMARVGPDVYENCLTNAHCNEMDFTGKAMKGFVYVGTDGLVNDSELEHWLNLCLAYNPFAKATKKKKKA